MELVHGNARGSAWLNCCQSARGRFLSTSRLARILAALSSLPPSSCPQIHLHCCLEGVQLTQIGSTVIGVLLTSASFLSIFDHSHNDSLFSFSLYRRKTKRKLLKELWSYIWVFWCTAMGNKIRILKCFFHFSSPLPSPPTVSPDGKHSCWELIFPSEGVVTIAATSPRVDMSKCWCSHWRPSSLSSLLVCSFARLCLCAFYLKW